MTWIRPWLGWASYDEIRAEADRRGMFPSTLPTAIIYKEISGFELYSAMPRTFVLDGKQWDTAAHIWDNKYKLTSIDEIKRFLSWNLVDKMNYVAEYYDCDNFMVSLWADCMRWTQGIALGGMMTTAHAKNIVLCSDMKTYEIEPQSDVVKELYSPVFEYYMC